MSNLSLAVYVTGDEQIHVVGQQADLTRLMDLLEDNEKVHGMLLAEESGDELSIVFESCLSCEQPRVDSGEGRFCEQCNDHRGTCTRDHCLACGGAT